MNIYHFSSCSEARIPFTSSESSSDMLRPRWHATAASPSHRQPHPSPKAIGNQLGFCIKDRYITLMQS